MSHLMFLFWTLTKIDFDDWVDMEWYFEATFKAGTGTASVRLYNVTDSSAVAVGGTNDLNFICFSSLML